MPFREIVWKDSENAKEREIDVGNTRKGRLPEKTEHKLAFIV